jgi:hypothetical protein
MTLITWNFFDLGVAFGINFAGSFDIVICDGLDSTNGNLASKIGPPVKR